MGWEDLLFACQRVRFFFWISIIQKTISLGSEKSLTWNAIFKLYYCFCCKNIMFCMGISPVDFLFFFLDKCALRTIDIVQQAKNVCYCQQKWWIILFSYLKVDMRISHFLIKNVKFTKMLNFFVRGCER